MGLTPASPHTFQLEGYANKSELLLSKSTRLVLFVFVGQRVGGEGGWMEVGRWMGGPDFREVSGHMESTV